MENLQRHQDFAKAFVNHPSYIETTAYIRDTGVFAVYDPSLGHFVIQDVEQFDEIIYRFMLSCSKKSISTSSVIDVREQIKMLVPRKFDTAISPYLALTDCVLDTRTFQAQPFNIDTPVFFSAPTSLTSANNLTVAGTRFELFLKEVLVNADGSPDFELHNVVQELFGYCILPNLNAEASFFLVGEGSNGKSVLLSLLESIIGPKMCSSVSVERMTTKEHATTSLVNKRLNICYEEESQFAKSDKFKALVSGEPTTIDYKFGRIYSARLPVKYVFSTNELPAFSGFNHGLLRRIKIIPFKRTFQDHQQDRQLKQKLLSELPAITAWALQGAKRLTQNDFKFTASVALEESKAEFESNLSAAVNFLREEYTESTDSFVFASDLYNHFTEWCEQNGKKRMSKPTFLRDVSRSTTLPTVSKWNPDTSKTERCQQLAKISGLTPKDKPSLLDAIEF